MLNKIQKLIQQSSISFAQLNLGSQILAILIFSLVLPFHFASIALFALIFPVLFIYCWARFFLKKLLGIKPAVLFSPGAIAMNFLIARSVRTQNWQSDVFTYDIEPVFEDMRIGKPFPQSPAVKVILYFSAFIPIFCWAVLKYDIFESPFTGGVLSLSLLRKYEFFLLKVLAKKIVVYGFGSDSQIPSEIKKMGKYNAYMDFSETPDTALENYIRQNIARANKYADVEFSGFIKLSNKMLFIPIPADLSKWDYLPLKKKKIITIVHSTNHRIYKGTRFIIKAVEELKKEGLPIKLLLIEKKTIKECYRLYRQGDIFIPHIIGGWYGSTPCEGMALGRPVICYLDKNVAKLYEYFGRYCPIVNANPDNLKEKIRKLAKNFELRKKLGKAGADYVRKYHTFKIAGKLRVLVYERIWEGKKINQQIFEREIEREKIW